MDTRDDRNIVLTGFMGTGKSAVGQIVAARLNRPFVDTDAVIVEQAGKPIAEIFAQDGEEAFRYMERRVCRFYAGQSGFVIATGGGMLVDPSNLAVMVASGLVFCLNAMPDTIRERLEGQNGRPLFAGDWEGLLEKRRSAYAATPYQIDTDNKTAEDVAEEVIASCRISL
ncbi:MAG: shikimate kinase [Anaerolineae bacterium]|nr:shikimate kinase [Anaerolineae bacterium]